MEKLHRIFLHSSRAESLTQNVLSRCPAAFELLLPRLPVRRRDAHFPDMVVLLVRSHFVSPIQRHEAEELEARRSLRTPTHVRVPVAEVKFWYTVVLHLKEQSLLGTILDRAEQRPKVPRVLRCQLLKYPRANQGPRKPHSKRIPHHGPLQESELLNSAGGLFGIDLQRN